MGCQTSPVSFNMLIKPVGAGCNLHCSYCYYPQGPSHRPTRISDELLENFIINYIKAQPENAREINFVWQGGEPLLAGLEFYKTAILLQQKHAPKLATITNSLQTNATLLNHEWCHFFKTNGFILGVSLDGPEEIHDKNRRMRRNTGSFHKVMNGIKLLQKHQIEFNILTVVHDDICEQAEVIYDFLKNQGFSYIQFQPLVNEGDAKTHNYHLSEEKWGVFMKKIYEYWESSHDVGKIFIINIEQAFSQYFTHRSTSCVHAPRCGANLVMEADGKLYACDHLIDDRHFVGQFSDHKTMIAAVNQSLQMDFGQKKSQRPECRQCAVRALCQGGCPTHINSKGRNSLCYGYKRFFGIILTRLLPYERSYQGFLKWRKAVLEQETVV